MTAQMALRALPSIPAAAVKARTTWMASQDAPEPLRTAGTVIHVAQGREIFAEGDDTDVFYKVVSGVVRACKFLSDGRRQIEAFHVAGNLFGFELGEVVAQELRECGLRRRRCCSLRRLCAFVKDEQEEPNDPKDAQADQRRVVVAADIDRDLLSLLDTCVEVLGKLRVAVELK